MIYITAPALDGSRHFVPVDAIDTEQVTEEHYMCLTCTIKPLCEDQPDEWFEDHCPFYVSQEV